MFVVPLVRMVGMSDDRDVMPSWSHRGVLSGAECPETITPLHVAVDLPARLQHAGTESSQNHCFAWTFMCDSVIAGHITLNRGLCPLESIAPAVSDWMRLQHARERVESQNTAFAHGHL
jgi:hypothetical protein